MLCRLSDIELQLVVNGVAIDVVELRPGNPQGPLLELAIRDPVYGGFSLHDGFELSLVRGGSDAGWERVSVTQLKDAVANALRRAAALPGGDSVAPPACEPVLPLELESAAATAEPLSIDPDGPHAYIRRAQEILYRANIAHLLLDISDEGPGGSSRALIMVQRLLGAGVWLRRAGFSRSPEDPKLLLAPAGKGGIQLFEHKCKWEPPAF